MAVTTLFTIRSTVEKDFLKKRSNYLFSIKCDETFFSHIKGKKKRKSQPQTKNETVVAKEQLCWPRQESLRKCLGKYFDLCWMCPSWFAWEASPFTWSEDSGNFSPLLGGGERLLGNEKRELNIMNFLLLSCHAVVCFPESLMYWVFPQQVPRTLQQASWVIVTHLHPVVE